MQRLRHEEEPAPYRFDRESAVVEEERLAVYEETKLAARTEAPPSLPLGIAQGALAAWVMTELGRLSNPLLQIDGRSGWQLYALLGGIAGLAAATGRRNTAWAASGMAAAILVSPPLLEWLLRATGRSYYVLEPGPSALLIVAALALGAFTWLKRVGPLRAAMMGTVGFFVIDIVYNVARHGGGPGFEAAAVISAEHGFLLGGVLALMQAASQNLLEWRTRWIDRAADWTMTWLKQTKSD